MTDGVSPEDKALAESLFARWDWGNGESKSELEREVWDDGSSHGRRFDRFIFRALGISTKKSAKIYTYSDGWIDLVIEELSDADRFGDLVGHAPRAK